MTEASLHRFGRFEIRPLERQLLIDGKAATVGSRAFDVLLALAERAGRLVSKSELLDIVWPHTVVEENNLQVQISSLRKLLGPTVIATIPGRGYRFTAPEAAALATETLAPLPMAPPASATSPSPAAGPVLATNLPQRLPALIGRDNDLAALHALLPGHALLTLLGPGGIGKTLLAQHLLHAHRDRHSHGVCFVELAAIADARQVTGAIAAAIGVHTDAGADALDGLVKAVAPLGLLLALDNAEHLLGEVARIARALHAGAPGLQLVVTSQAPLQLDAERVYRVAALALPEADAAPSIDVALGYGAVALFVERAQAADRRFALDARNVGAVIGLCRRLDGLPLAIGLAAARVPLLGIDGLAAAIDERLKLLTTGHRDAAARHRTLRAALEWSHGLLDAREQTVFRRLAVMAGSGSLDLVRQVAADATLDEWAVLDALGVLVERSLVALDGGGADTAAPRYRLLESPRAYAQERLAAAGEEDAVRARHAAAVAALFERAFEQYYDGLHGSDDWQRDIAPDVENARAALVWGVARDAPVAAAIAPALLLVLFVNPVDHRAACDLIEPLLDERVPPLVRARVRLVGSIGLPTRRAVEWARASAALYGSIDDPSGRYLALGQLAWALALSGDCEGAAAALAELDALPASTVPRVAAKAEMARGGLALARHGWEDTLRHFRRAAQLWEASGSSETMPWINLVEVQVLAGHLDDALRGAQGLLERLRGTRWASRVSMVQIELVAIWLAKGELGAARALAADAWPQAAAFGMQSLLADHVALLAAMEGRPRAAARLAGHADAFYATQQDTRQLIEVRSVERARALSQAALGHAEVERLQAAGAALGDEAARLIAFGTEDEPA